jgi:hypothetical protein
MSRPWPDWRGETVAILASGPSLTRAQADYVRGKCRVIAVNNQGIDTETDGIVQPALAPWADILYAADAKWWNCYRTRALAFAGLKVSGTHVAHPGVHTLKRSHQKVFDPRPTHVCGSNSGYQALHLAVQLGATRILLLGFDLRFGVNGRKHNHGNHPPRLNSRPNFATWRHQFDQLAPVLRARGVEVVNCSPSSALTAFKRASLEVMLGH